MSTHTPGPWGWTYDGSSDYSIGPADDPQSRRVAHVHSRDPERGSANARLIAAAPELLDALRAFVGDHEATGMACEGLNAAYLHAKKIIAKATQL